MKDGAVLFARFIRPLQWFTVIWFVANSTDPDQSFDRDLSDPIKRIVSLSLISIYASTQTVE